MTMQEQTEKKGDMPKPILWLAGILLAVVVAGLVFLLATADFSSFPFSLFSFEVNCESCGFLIKKGEECRYCGLCRECKTFPSEGADGYCDSCREKRAEKVLTFDRNGKQVFP